MTSREDSGDLLDRCTLEIRVPDGPGLGTGVLIGSGQVLTCSHVVKAHERVDLYEGPSSARLTGARVERRGDPEGPDDLALLELDEPLPGRGRIRFVDRTRNEDFAAVGFPAGGRAHTHGRVHGRSELHDWLEIDVEGSRKIRPGFSGGAVWVQRKQAAVGLVTRYGRDGLAYAVTRGQIDAFRQLADSGMETRCAGYLSRVEGRLRTEGVQEAIAEADSAGTWREVAEHANLLAEALCLETDPEDLTRGLSAAYCRLARGRRHETAEAVWQVLLEALPAALLSRWRIEVPESPDPQVRLQVVGRVLAEFALAAAEDGAAAFHRRPRGKGSDIPWAKHRVPGPGELGADPEGEEAAAELAQELGLRLALDAGLGPNSPIEKSFLGVLASGRHTGDDTLLFDHAEVKEYQGAPAGTLLELLNERLAEPTESGGRRLYLVAEDDDEALVEALGRRLPGLKVVMLEPPPDLHKATGTVVHALKKIFHRRNPERAES